MIHADRWRWRGGGGRRIVIVPSRARRIQLCTERYALPFGIGGSLIIPLYVHSMMMRSGLPRWVAIAQCALSIGWVVIGVWRPMHRLLGIRRSDYIFPTFPP